MPDYFDAKSLHDRDEKDAEALTSVQSPEPIEFVGYNVLSRRERGNRRKKKWGREGNSIPPTERKGGGELGKKGGRRPNLGVLGSKGGDQAGGASPTNLCAGGRRDETQEAKNSA